MSLQYHHHQLRRCFGHCCLNLTGRSLRARLQFPHHLLPADCHVVLKQQVRRMRNLYSVELFDSDFWKRDIKDFQFFFMFSLIELHFSFIAALTGLEGGDCSSHFGIRNECVYARLLCIPDLGALLATNSLSIASRNEGSFKYWDSA